MSTLRKLTLENLERATAMCDPVAAVVTTDTPRNRYVTGYGRRIPTAFMVNACLDERNPYRARWYRVYVMNYGNAGSTYVSRRDPATGDELVYFLDSDVDAVLMRASEISHERETAHGDHGVRARYDVETPEQVVERHSPDSATAARLALDSKSTPFILQVFRRGSWRPFCGLWNVATPAEAVGSAETRRREALGPNGLRSYEPTRVVQVVEGATRVIATLGCIS